MHSKTLKYRNTGFSLMEVAVVLLIIGLLLGGLISPMSAQRENAKVSEVKKQLAEIQEAVLGFAAAKGRLPCPTIPNNSGLESGGGAGNCVNGAAALQHGFVPVNTLGLSGPLNSQGLLLDPWGSPIRYSVTNSDADVDNLWDFVVDTEMSDVGMAALAPDLLVCGSESSNPSIPCSAGDEVARQIPVIVFSLGKDWADFTSDAQDENAGEGVNARLGGHLIATDDVFVSQLRNTVAGAEFDDEVVWISAQIMYAKMMQAGQLP